MSKPEKKKSTLTYLFNNSTESVEDGKHMKLEQVVANGENGASFKYFKKNGDKKFKITARQEAKGKDLFKLIVIEGDKKDEKMVKLSDVIKEIKGRKELEFALKYFEKDVKMSRQSSQKRSSKKSSKKASKKASKKTSRKGSRKTSKKSSKKKSSKK